MKQAQKNFKLLLKIVQDFDALENGKVFQADGFMDLVIVVKEKNQNYFLLDVGHFYLSEKGKIVPDPLAQIKVNLHQEKIAPLYLQNSFFGITECFDKKGEEVFPKEKAIAEVSDFLELWFNNILLQKHKPVLDKWELQLKQESKDYYFDGRMLMTQGANSLLSVGEIVLLTETLKNVALQEKGIDYLQVFRHSKTNKEIWAIDQLSKEMKEGSGYSSQEVKEYNYFTILLPEEY